jgi:hypothetical protein
MNLASIKKTRGKSSAWTDWPIEMAKIRPLKRLLKRQKTTDTTLNHGMALDDRDGVPRNPQVEVEPLAIEVQTGKDLIPAAVEADRRKNDPPTAVMVPEEDHVARLRKAHPEDFQAAKVIDLDKPVETRKQCNDRIEKLWYDFHKAKIPDEALDMDRELKDYMNPERTSDAEAWKFADLLTRALLVAGARAR